MLHVAPPGTIEPLDGDDDDFIWVPVFLVPGVVLNACGMFLLLSRFVS